MGDRKGDLVSALSFNIIAREKVKNGKWKISTLNRNNIAFGLRDKILFLKKILLTLHVKEPGLIHTCSKEAGCEIDM